MSETKTKTCYKCKSDNGRGGEASGASGTEGRLSAKRRRVGSLYEGGVVGEWWSGEGLKYRFDMTDILGYVTR